MKYYTEKLGFRAVKHYDKIKSFAAIYRDEIEFIIVQSKKGKVESNSERYGAGYDAYIYDAYIDTATPDRINPIYEEFKAKGVKIVTAPHKTDYGTYEFVIEDIDKRLIGIGRIFDNNVFFKDLNWHR